ncbi:MAG: SH3 domain-containing protein [Anaerolineae bacterium]|nr:SH3 domain-containing protein [Anaerolineae bacterium]NUQ04662.1 SH3 domain-containing protein [Anaerolineae bacterium]
MSLRRVFIALALTLVLALPAFAQTLPQTGVVADPNANISWPPPVYVLRGQFEVRGTANLPNMSNYFIEFRPLGSDLQPLTPDDWFPAILPSASAVVDGVLGAWDTRLTPDGLYELRLTVNVTGGQAVQQSITPLRLENTPPPFAVTPTTVPTATQPPAPPATPTPEPTVNTTPRVRITTPQGNLREGDSTAYRIIVTLPNGTELNIRGISNRGSGWYYVMLPDGRLGWMSPDIVETLGDLTGLPLVAPPPPPAPTAAPIPTAAPVTAAPASNANLVAGIVVLDPGSPNCAQTFTVGFDVANLGSENTIASGTVSLVDVRAADGSVQGTTIGGFPVLSPGQTFRVNMPLTISTWYNETHRITLTIDSGNAIPENNEGDNARTHEYTLQKGSCP